MMGELQAADPRSVGPYRLLGRLGTGGMGHVFLGRSARGRLVAVKLIKPELAGEPGFRARFAREVVAARNVGGLFTALVIDADVQGPMPWLATAYVAGPSLAEAVDNHGPLPVSSVLTLAAGLAEGLEAIHAAGVVHRDLKPSNVLLAEDGPRVIDFGISRAAEASMLTQSGTIMGSPGFMSPEQAEGGAVGPFSDVFSLGAVLTFAVTGQGPFGAGPTPALLYRVVHCDPDTAHLPPEIRPLAERCLAKDPSERPTTSDLLAELGTGQLGADWLPAPITEVFDRYVPSAPPAPSAPPVAAGPAGAGWTDAEDATVGFPALPADALAGPPTEAAALVGAAGLAGAASPAGAAGLAESGGPAGAAGLAESGGPAGSAASAQPGPADIRSRRWNWRRPAWAAVVAVLIVGSAAGGVALRTALGQQQIAAGSSPPPASPAPASASVPSFRPASPKAADVPKSTFPAAQVPASSAQAAPGVAQVPASTSPSLPASSPASTPSSSPTMTAVPDVLGSTLPAATSALKARGFDNISSVEGCYGSTQIGDVIKQVPGAGAQAAPTSLVQLSIQASNCNTVPDVVGMTESAATSLLQQAGFTDINSEDACLGSTAIGDVVTQSPAAGTSYGASQQVTIELQADNCT